MTGTLRLGRDGLAGLSLLAALAAPAVVSVDTAEGSIKSSVPAGFSCDHVVIKVDCLEAYATNVSNEESGGTRIGSVKIEKGDPDCPKFTAACIYLYQEGNGLPGLQRTAQEVQDYYDGIGGEAPDPPPKPDSTTGSLCGELSQPSDNVLIAGFSSTSSSGENATEWELRTERDGGTADRFSGTF